jgi:hypothetical protein
VGSKIVFSQTKCNQDAESVRIYDTDQLHEEGANRQQIANKREAVKQMADRDALEIEELSRRELKMMKDLDDERDESRRSLGALVEAKPKIRWIENELESVRRQKRALMGHESSDADSDARIRNLERRVESTERKPIVENFTVNGRPCQRVMGNINCF